jgi:single-stranded-DNA-specific exonuclease
MKRLDELAEAAAKSLLQCDSFRVISHNDADGVTSAGLICNALFREDIPFHATLVSRLDDTVIDSIEGPVIFCDMGSGKPDLISRVDSEVFVFDHHRPVGKLDCIHVNPHLVGIDGAFELSASGTVYTVVRKMGESSGNGPDKEKSNLDLAGLALVGALGDRQAMRGANRAILEEALNAGVVEIRPGLKMEDGSLDEIFEKSIEPLLDMTGDSIKVAKFLDEINVHGELQNLGQEDLSKLSTSLVLKLLMQGSFAADSVVGEAIRLKKEVVENAFEMVHILNACGKLGSTGLALTLCLRDDSVLQECKEIADDYRSKILLEVKRLKNNLQEMDNIRYFIDNDLEAAGVLAGMAIRYLYPDRPLIVMNRIEEMVKISARGNRVLVSKGLDLSVALKEAAEVAGGGGGGHNVASGAAIPLGKEEAFLRHVNEVVGKQLQRLGSGKK